MMKLNRMLAICGMAALCLSAATLMAQNDTGGGGGQGRQGRGPGGGGNFDPAQRQQMMMDNIKEQLGFTNDTDWNAVQPLVQKVTDARREIGFGGGGMFRRGGRNNNNGNQGGGGRPNFGGTPNPDAEVLQKAIDSNAPSAQIKAALEKYRLSQKDKETKLAKAQDDLRKVLTTKQEAGAVLLGLLN